MITIHSTVITIDDFPEFPERVPCGPAPVPCPEPLHVAATAPLTAAACGCPYDGDPLDEFLSALSSRHRPGVSAYGFEPAV
ncbi:hypothetical protein [Bifidobacterium avesanii]|uniref:Uncharacterized protein n=1 Tax=Bifidobacterium avesanii TaxID=1798157 RepID=A0A7K3TGR0_9BIFI|nr:hypothetical protein [Bifidobacterium avesanii]KAB8291507.1 hypothetical protein DSM100685_1225 [Bifidobacterium avesanii]NEG77864.1 hypothetical protein [Bifidobacterium avesanii]